MSWRRRLPSLFVANEQVFGSAYTKYRTENFSIRTKVISKVRERERETENKKHHRTYPINWNLCAYEWANECARYKKKPTKKRKTYQKAYNIKDPATPCDSLMISSHWRTPRNALQSIYSRIRMATKEQYYYHRRRRRMMLFLFFLHFLLFLFHRVYVTHEEKKRDVNNLLLSSKNYGVEWNYLHEPRG